MIMPKNLVNQTFDQSLCSPICKIPPFTTPPVNENYAYSEVLAEYLQEKELLLDELPFSLKKIHEHYENGYLTYVKGIVKKNDQYQCVRCGNRHQQLFATFSCARCHDECTYCRKCIELGRVSECHPLIRWLGPVPPMNKKRHRLAWELELSPFQQKASTEIIKAIKERKELLIWAVAGSGKTEMLYEGIAYALAEGRKVLIATPRTDVVLELAPRLKAAFPTTTVLALYGGSSDRRKNGEIYIATTHQLLRFYRAFDVIIIDEVDAFPYSYDESLAYAVQKAQKPQATVIYLTATPSSSMQKRVSQNDLHCVKVARRYHGYPLPVPTFQWCGNWRKQLQKDKLPKQLLSWLKNHAQQPIFLFVPTISILEKVTKILKSNDFLCEGVHSEDPMRHDKVKQFREGKLPLLVTTTILERGVTVANVQVAVLGADHDIFTESALVQIAGRAGRNIQYPDGDVTFFHYGITKEMKKAKRHIISMNEVQI